MTFEILSGHLSEVDVFDLAAVKEEVPLAGLGAIWSFSAGGFFAWLNQCFAWNWHYMKRCLPLFLWRRLTHSMIFEEYKRYRAR